jgi:hypothetical protein
MKNETLTFNMVAKTVKEIRFSTEDLEGIKYADRQKARLENQGFTLVREKAGFHSTTLVYRKELSL